MSINFINKKQNSNDMKILLGSDVIYSNNLNQPAIDISNVDFSLYKAIVIQIGGINEGDSMFFPIESGGNIINEVSHFNMKSNASYYCAGYGVLSVSNGIGNIEVVPKEMSGWTATSVKVYGIVR